MTFALFLKAQASIVVTGRLLIVAGIVIVAGQALVQPVMVTLVPSSVQARTLAVAGVTALEAAEAVGLLAVKLNVLLLAAGTACGAPMRPASPTARATARRQGEPGREDITRRS